MLRPLRRATGVTFEASARVGHALGPSLPGSLEFFLCERYQFYAEHRGELRRARVHHEPYLLHAAHDVTVSADLLHAAGLPSDGTRTPDYFSPGVDVSVYALERVR